MQNIKYRLLKAMLLSSYRYLLCWYGILATLLITFVELLVRKHQFILGLFFYFKLVFYFSQY